MKIVRQIMIGNTESVELSRRVGRPITTGKSRIERPFFSRADNEQEEQAEPHGEIRARFVHHAPKTVTRQFREGESPEAVAQ